jgi:hypothetical protein
MEPIVGFHLVGVINFAALCFINSYIYDPQQTLWIVLYNVLVYLPVVVAYVVALVNGTSRRVNRKRFFYACALNNVASAVLLFALFTMLYYGRYSYNIYAQP